MSRAVTLRKLVRPLVVKVHPDRHRANPEAFRINSTSLQVGECARKVMVLHGTHVFVDFPFYADVQELNGFLDVLDGTEKREADIRAGTKVDVRFVLGENQADFIEHRLRIPPISTSLQFEIDAALSKVNTALRRGGGGGGGCLLAARVR